MPVERRGRDVGVLDHLVDAYCADSAAREQLVGGVENPLASAPRLGRPAGFKHASRVH